MRYLKAFARSAKKISGFYRGVKTDNGAPIQALGALYNGIGSSKTGIGAPKKAVSSQNKL